MLQVFLDANVYVAGILSRHGASSVVLELARREKFVVLASRLVLREAERNLRKKATPNHLKSFHRYLKQTQIYIVPPLDNAILATFEAVIHPKDVPVLAAAVEAKVDYLVTLDRRHFLTPRVTTRSGKTRILTPGDFLETYNQTLARGAVEELHREATRKGLNRLTPEQIDKIIKESRCSRKQRL